MPKLGGYTHRALIADAGMATNDLRRALRKLAIAVVADDGETMLEIIEDADALVESMARKVGEMRALSDAEDRTREVQKARLEERRELQSQIDELRTAIQELQHGQPERSGR